MTGTDRRTAAEELTIRRAEGGDLAVLAELYLVARNAAVPAMPPLAHPADDVRAWVAGWDLARRETWLAERAAGPVGFVQLREDWLEMLYVAPKGQRCGVGSALLELAKVLRPGGFRLWVFEGNAPARACYARHGLVELEHTDGSGNEERTPDVRMAWPGADPVGFFRQLIDGVDAELADLLARRAALSAAIQSHQSEAGRDDAREREIAASMAGRAPALSEDRRTRIVHAIITESLDAAGD